MKYLILALTIFSLGCGQETKNKRAIIFGDSIGKAPNGYAVQFIHALGNYTIDNEAVGGSKLDDVVQFDRIMNFDFSPGDIVVFMPGMNDACFYKGDPTYTIQYIAMLRTILDHLGSKNIKVYLGTPSRVLDQVNITWGMQQVYKDAITSVFNEKDRPNMKLTDVFTNFNPTLDTMDGEVHPNNKGAAEIASLFYQNL